MTARWIAGACGCTAKKKTARTVNCPCREASDATCEGWSAIQVVLSGAASFLNSYRMPQNQPRCTKYLHFPYIFSGQSSKFHRYRPKARRTKSRNWRENSYFGLILKNNGDLADPAMRNAVDQRPLLAPESPESLGEVPAISSCPDSCMCRSREVFMISFCFRSQVANISPA